MIVFPQSPEYGIVLYKEGHKTNLQAILHRQLGEPIVEYIQRKKAWYNKLQTICPGTIIPDEIGAEFLISCAALDDQQRQTVRFYA